MQIKFRSNRTVVDSLQRWAKAEQNNTNSVLVITLKRRFLGSQFTLKETRLSPDTEERKLVGVSSPQINFQLPKYKPELMIDTLSIMPRN